MGTLFSGALRLIGLLLSLYGGVAGVQGYQSEEMPHTIEWWTKIVALVGGGAVTAFFPNLKTTWQKLLAHLRNQPIPSPVTPPAPTPRPADPDVNRTGTGGLAQSVDPRSPRAKLLLHETELAVELAEHYADDPEIGPKIIELHNLMFQKQFGHKEPANVVPPSS